MNATGREILVYADGSCIGNPGPGGWGVVIVEPRGGRSELCGFDPATTNNRMELTAAIEGLRATLSGARVLLRSDSEYLVKSIKLGWKRNVNIDLWRLLDAELAKRNVQLEWVRGHAEDPLNHRADELALGAARSGLEKGVGAPASSTSARWLAELTRSDQVAQIEALPAAALPQQPQAETVKSVALSESERQIVAQLGPMLRRGEALCRCTACARIFVAASRIAPAYCSLVECQLKARTSA